MVIGPVIRVVRIFHCLVFIAIAIAVMSVPIIEALYFFLDVDFLAINKLVDYMPKLQIPWTEPAWKPSGML
jgi:hypothetical protein